MAMRNFRPDIKKALRITNLTELRIRNSKTFVIRRNKNEGFTPSLKNGTAPHVPANIHSSYNDNDASAAKTNSMAAQERRAIFSAGFTPSLQSGIMRERAAVTENPRPRIVPVIGVAHQTWRHRRRHAALSAGFTLLEVVVSLGIFFVIIITAVGAVLAIKNAQIKASNIQIIQDNLRFALEFITKELRAASNFSVADCAGNPSICRQINFTHSLPAGGTEEVGFCLSNETIQRLRNTSDCAQGSPITSDDIAVERLLFYVVEQSSPAIQPRLTVAIQARSRDIKLATQFRLQTTVVKRSRQ